MKSETTNSLFLERKAEATNGVPRTHSLCPHTTSGGDPHPPTPVSEIQEGGTIEDGMRDVLCMRRAPSPTTTSFGISPARSLRIAASLPR